MSRSGGCFRFWFWRSAGGSEVQGRDADGAGGGHRNLTAVTTETLSTHTAVRLPTGRVVMATRMTSGYKRRGNKERKWGEETMSRGNEERKRGEKMGRGDKERKRGKETRREDGERRQ